MPTIEHNKRYWETYDWSQHGHEWSSAWGDSELLWLRTVLPRLRAFLPAGHIVEIGCGHGRFTHLVGERCKQYTGIDLALGCVNFCAKRFPQHTFLLTDGRSFPPLAPVDLVFSFDSLVHAENEAIAGYIQGLPQVLTADGVAFLHHSNMGAYAEPIASVHGRGRDVSALGVRQLCHQAGLKCYSQELIAWGWQGLMCDCITVLGRPEGRFDRPFMLRENAAFMAEAFSSRDLALLYGDAR